MTSQCDYCIDPLKTCNHSCKDTACAKYIQCHRKLSAIIRITTKCTQSCHHCCFACSPDHADMMDLATANKINLFMTNHHFFRINIMGGEFFCNPLWDQIIPILSKNIRSIRLTTNGDWGNNPQIQQKLLELTHQFPIIIAISRDKYHTNRYVDQAYTFCLQNKIPCHLSSGEVNNSETIVPIKKGYFYAGFMAGISKYCGDYQKQYEIMIDEQGYISKCPMGLWKYNNVQEYITSDPKEFYDRFKQIQKGFRYIMSCSDCVRIYDHIGKKFEENVIINSQT